jgi:hypothetical protein
MGWLRELMAAAPKPIGSLGRLAEVCLKHEAWPEYVQPQARSLASLYSKLDRGIELDWLRDRPDVQHALTLILGCSAAEILRPLNRDLEPGVTTGQRWKLPDASAARPIELNVEELPPGLPRELMSPERWGHACWRPTSAAELDLVRRWLEGRSLARVSSAARPEPIKSERWLVIGSDWRNAPVSELPVNVCVVTVADEGQRPTTSVWTQLGGEPVRTWAGPFAEWLVPRLPRERRLEIGAAKNWLTRAARDGLVDGVESAASLLACLDELDPGPQFTDSWLQIAERFVRLRLQRASVQERSEAMWLATEALPTLTALMERALADHALPWDSPRSPDRWLDLVPPELQQGLDADWARRSLSRAPNPVLAKDLEKALSNVPPGAFRIVRALEAAGLLSGVDALQFGPRWLGLLLRRSIEQGVAKGPATSWGQALLLPAVAERLRDELAERIETDAARVVEALFDLEEDPSAATTLSIETVFQLIGQALLMGQTIDKATLQAIWDLQAARWLQLDLERTAPNTLCACEDLDAYGQWLICAWAISERLEETHAHPSVAPWAAPADVPDIILDAVLVHLEHTKSPPIRKSAFELVGRLAGGPPAPLPHRLFLPFRVPVGLTSDPPTVTWQDWLLLRGSWVLQDLVTDALAALPAAIERVWQLWADAGKPLDAPLLAPTDSAVLVFWPHLPDEMLTELLRTEHPFTSNIPYVALSRSSFQRLLLAAHAWQAGGLAQLPPDLLPIAVEALARRKDRGALVELWAKFEHGMVSELERLAGAFEWACCGAIFSAAPRGEARELLAFVEQRLSSNGVADPITHLARPWLQCLAAQPGPLRLRAYATLRDIEERLARIRAVGN